VLRSGNHAAIARWRRDRAVERTAVRRPDLLAALPPGALDSADQAVLEELAMPPGAAG
jgi:tRNA (guanine37-N1)-methyltransferase